MCYFICNKTSVYPEMPTNSSGAPRQLKEGGCLLSGLGFAFFPRPKPRERSGRGPALSGRGRPSLRKESGWRLLRRSSRPRIPLAKNSPARALPDPSTLGMPPPPEAPSSPAPPAALPGLVGSHLPLRPFPNSRREESGAALGSPGWAGQKGFSAAQDAEPGRMERCPGPPGAPAAWPGLLAPQRALPAQHHPRCRRRQ